jgi:hypothetical protein
MTPNKPGSEAATIQDRRPNFRSRSKDRQLFLVRCFNCVPNHGRENWAPAVASGQCAWCGWKEELAKEEGR